MQKEILDYIQTERVGVLAVILESGAPHGATLHFAYSEGDGAFYFQTFDGSIKGAAILGKEKMAATFVLGTDEEKMKTLQADGHVERISEPLIEEAKAVFFGKFPEKVEKFGPHTLCFKFTPTWWRFTDMKAPGGKLVLTSN